VLTTDLRTWGHVFNVNFFASAILARGLIDELVAAQGAIVNVTSIAGARVHPFAGAAYATSKAALAALTREMAHDLGPLGIRVNAIAPGEIETDILSPGTETLAETIPLRRLGKPEEVARTIYYLCTPRAPTSRASRSRSTAASTSDDRRSTPAHPLARRRGIFSVQQNRLRSDDRRSAARRCPRGSTTAD
jgi:NAD(P)-dependent dehydrogenase (short-subunit alcohol dehydrogenase family)